MQSSRDHDMAGDTLAGSGIGLHGRLGPGYDTVLTAPALNLLAEPPGAHQCRRAARFPARDRGHPRRRLEGRADPGRPAGPPRRDHRAGRAQDDHQRAELRREDLHGRLRGFELADLGQPDRRARAICATRCGGTIDFTTPEGKAYRLNEQDRDADRPSARLAPRRGACDGRRRADLRLAVRLRPVPLPQRQASCSNAAAARTSTCPSSRAISRRGCGTT
jgi:hypothetical protein